MAAVTGPPPASNDKSTPERELKMILWTIQPNKVYQEIITAGIYHCDFTRSAMVDCKPCYDWLVQEMKKRIGPPPAGVTYPVLAWYQWEGRYAPETGPPARKMDVWT